MTVTNTSLLGLALPTTGTESGVWGDDVNNGLTILIDVSVAGTNNITQDSDITLSVSNGNNSSTFTSTATNSTVAQYSTLNCTGARGAIRNIIAPASSRTFVVINNTTGGFAIVIKKSGGTGVNIAPNETAIVYYDSVTATDYVKVSSTVNVSSFSAGTTGFTPSTATTGAVTLSGTLATTNGGTGLTSFTANGVVYASSTSALATGSALTWNGTSLVVNQGSPSASYTVDVGGSIRLNASGADTQVAIRSASSYANFLYYGEAGVADRWVVGNSGGSGDLAWRQGAYSMSTGSEKMRLTSAGYLGIGTSSPSTKLQVSGGAITFSSGGSGGIFGDNDASYSILQASSTANAAAIYLNGTTRTSFGSYLQYAGAVHQWFNASLSTEWMRIDSSGNFMVGGTGYTAAKITAVQQSDTVGTLSFGLGAGGGVAQGLRLTSGNALAFDRYNGSWLESARIDSSGNLLVGQTSASGKLSVTGTGSGNTGILAINATDNSSAFVWASQAFLAGMTSNQNFVHFIGKSASSLNAGYIGYKYSGTSGSATNILTFGHYASDNLMNLDGSGNLLVGYTSSNGSYKLQVNSQIFATSAIIATSDKNYKTNVTPISNGLRLVNKLNPVSFDWKEHIVHDFDTKNTYVGFLAQDIQESFKNEKYINSIIRKNETELPDGTKEEFLGLSDNSLIPILVKAIQELSAKVTALEAKLGV